MIKEINLDISGVHYSFNTYTAKKGLGILRRLVAILGPSFAELVEGAGDDAVNDLSISTAISQLVTRIDNDEVERLIFDMTSELMKNGQPVQFDLEFAANYGALANILIEIVRENYSSLFTVSGLAGNHAANLNQLSPIG